MTVKPWLRTRNSGHRGAIGSAWERTSVLCRERLPLERLPRGGRLAEDVSRLALKFTMTGDESLATASKTSKRSEAAFWSAWDGMLLARQN